MKELYKLYRPRTLKDMVGNSTTVSTLEGMIAKGTLPHTILFHGPSGCGKTTLARILKTELKCGKADFRELNLADFRGVDTVREIARNMSMAPIGGVCRIFLLDEVHQLTKDGQNAALKILEDTPSHVYFLLCTTDPGKLLKTIRTRCSELAVSPLDDEEVETLLRTVAKKAEIKLRESVRDEIIKNAEGSARTALVILDKIRHLEGKAQLEAVKRAVEEETVAKELCQALIQKKPWAAISRILRSLKEEPETTRYAVLGYARAVLLGNGNHMRAYNVICSFEESFIYSKGAGLARACFEATHGNE